MNRNNGYCREEKSCCYFHPRQVLVGVCPLCLNERLLILAAKQQGGGHHHNHRPSKSLQSSIQNRKATTTSSIHKIFAFGSLFTRSDSNSKLRKKSETYEEDDVSPSPEEESFISIKFEENGVASWEKGTVSNKVSLENCNKMSWKTHHNLFPNKDTCTKSVIEHAKSRDTFRWRRRIGHMFHLMRWKRTSGGVCHAGSKVEGVKVRKSWMMRTLTKRKTVVE